MPRLMRRDGLGSALMAHVLWTRLGGRCRGEDLRKGSCLWPLWQGVIGRRGAEEAEGGDFAQEGEDSAAALAGEWNRLGEFGRGLADLA